MQARIKKIYREGVQEETRVICTKVHLPNKFQTLSRMVNLSGGKMGCTHNSELDQAKRARIARLPCPLRLVHGLSLRSLSPVPAKEIPSHVAESKSMPSICHRMRRRELRLSLPPGGLLLVQQDRMQGGSPRILHGSSRLIVSVGV
jgi:hypothetical protein